MTQSVRRYVGRLTDDPSDQDIFERLFARLGLGLAAIESAKPGDVFSFEADAGLVRDLARDPEGRTLLYRRFYEAGDSRNEHRISLDPRLAPTEWADHANLAFPSSASHRTAEALIGADALRAFAQGGARHVNVVIADGEVDPAYLAPHLAAPGSMTQIPVAPPPPSGGRLGAPNRRHANLMARTVLSLAPHARIVSLPILPDRIDDVERFANRVLPALAKLRTRLGAAPHGGPDAAWVVVCAWGLVSREYETGVLNYSDERGHLLSKAFRDLVSENVDVVFSAGNNGLFAPDYRAGVYDRGPGGSIFGANGLPEVLTVGAVTPTGDWVGASSQGPEPAGLRGPDHPAPRKPDICAPSWFRFADDAHAIVTGTSGACAVAAGVVAALRRVVGPGDVPPAELIAHLRAAAAPRGHRGGDDRQAPASLRQGNGVVDCRSLVERLAAQPTDGSATRVES
ncbi:MAG: S8 family serine peptidase [Rubrimonas sp.]|uniref:S8 family serine peptidase n=1 Tax=Rubrimonas sp. TaxID=2036015 RepID=UPI002FDCDE81